MPIGAVSNPWDKTREAGGGCVYGVTPGSCGVHGLSRFVKAVVSRRIDVEILQTFVAVPIENRRVEACPGFDTAIEIKESGSDQPARREIMPS
jgi:hypothetical protein